MPSGEALKATINYYTFYIEWPLYFSWKRQK